MKKSVFVLSIVFSILSCFSQSSILTYSYKKYRDIIHLEEFDYKNISYIFNNHNSLSKNYIPNNSFLNKDTFFLKNIKDSITYEYIPLNKQEKKHIIIGGAKGYEYASLVKNKKHKNIKKIGFVLKKNQGFDVKLLIQFYESTKDEKIGNRICEHSFIITQESSLRSWVYLNLNKYNLNIPSDNFFITIKILSNNGISNENCNVVGLSKKYKNRTYFVKKDKHFTWINPHNGISLCNKIIYK